MENTPHLEVRDIGVFLNAFVEIFVDTAIADVVTNCSKEFHFLITEQLIIISLS